MKLKLNKKVIVISSVGAVSVTTAAIASGLVAYKDSFTNKQSSTSTAPNDDSGLDANPSNTSPIDSNDEVIQEETQQTTTEEDRVGSISSSVSKQINGLEVEFLTTTANNYGLNQNYNEFNLNGDFSKYTTTTQTLLKDIYLYVNSLWVNNQKNFDVTGVEINEFLSSDLDQINLNLSLISFKLTINIYAFKTTNIIIGDHTFTLYPTNNYQLIILVDSQLIKGIVNKTNSDEFYLGWKIDQATYVFNDSAFVTSFIPTYDSFSYAFQYIFSDLTTKQNYVQLYDQYQDEILDMDLNEVKTQIASFYDNQFELTLDYVNYGIKVLDILKTNPDVNTLLSKVVPLLSEMLVKNNILPAFLTPIIEDAFNSNLTLIEVFVNNKQAVIDYVNQEFSGLAEVIVPIIESIGYDMEQSAANEIGDLLVYLGIDESLVNVVTGDFLGITSNSKTLFNLIKDNYKTILTAFISVNNSDDVLVGLTNLFNLIFSVDKNNNLQPFLTLMFANSSNKQILLTALTKILSLSQISNILDIMVTNNKALTTDNIISLITALSNFLSGLFVQKENYVDFKSGYENLTFTTGFNTNPTINKENQTISFEYEISFKINKQVNLDLSKFKDLIDKKAIWDLICSFQDLSGLGWAVRKDWLKNAVLNYIPDTLSFGGSDNSIIFTKFTADNANIYFEPVAYESNYTLGYKFNYQTTISYVDPTLINSIGSAISTYEWHQIVPIFAWADFYYSETWQALIEGIILRDYVFTNQAKLNYDQNTIVATASDYDPNLYITGFEITPISDGSLDIYSLVKEENTTNLNSQTSYQITWKNNQKQTLLGVTPYVSNSISNQILTNYYDIKQTSDYIANTNLQYEYYSDILLDFNLPLNIVAKYIVGKTKINASFDIMLLNFHLYLPFMYYDTTTNKLTNSYVNSYSYFGSDISTNMSWFWQAAYYK